MIEMELGIFHKDGSFPFFIQFGNHSGEMECHTHKDFTELVIVMEGTATHLVKNQGYLVKKGDVFVIGGNTAHEYQDSRNFQICNIMFRPSFFFPLLSNIKESSGFHALFYLEPYLTKEYEFKSRLKLNEEEYRYLLPVLKKMVIEYHTRQEGWKEMLLSSFTELVVILSRSYSLPEKEQSDELLQIAKAVSYMEKNYCEPITVTDMATVACLSERHFTRIFKATYQYTPMQYVIRLRLLRSIELLKEPQLSITEIASLCGFSDNNYYARQFKASFQLSPGSYRKTLI